MRAMGAFMRVFLTPEQHKAPQRTPAPVALKCGVCFQVADNNKDGGGYPQRGGQLVAFRWAGAGGGRGGVGGGAPGSNGGLGHRPAVGAAQKGRHGVRNTAFLQEHLIIS